MVQTLNDLQVQGMERLSLCLASARLDTEVLLCAAFNCDSAYLLTHPEKQADLSHLSHFQDLLSRREQGEPIAYILGQKEFWSLPLKTTAATLIPRPETEHLVEQALSRLPLDREAFVFDLGTGSGAVAVAIASERPKTKIIAVDICPMALTVAEENAKNLDLHNVKFRLGSWYTPLQHLQADLIVSNPPYIRDDDPHLGKGDIVHEPLLALKGGKDGMDKIEKIAAGGKRHLKPKGHLLLEHGFDQSSAVQVCLQRNGYKDISTTQDYSGLDRITQCQIV